MTTPVDVLLIGAGALGAAVAWSLAETKMHILCLDEGDWMKPSKYPSTARDWEAHQFNDFHISPNRRKRDTDYPINDAGNWSQEYYETDRSRGFVRGYRFEFSRGQGAVMAAVHGSRSVACRGVPSTVVAIASCSATASAW